MTLKKNCERCRAINAGGRCSLGYNNTGDWISNIGMHRIKPQEPCPKPITIQQLFDAPIKGAPLKLSGIMVPCDPPTRGAFGINMDGNGKR